MSGQNPYQSPDSEIAREAPTGARVYRPGHTGLATFLGTPFAGFWLLASNYQAMGFPEKRNSALGVGLLATLGVFGLSWYLPESVPAIPINIAVVVGMMQYCKYVQGTLIENYVADGAAYYSGWRAAGIGMIGFLIVAIVGGALLFAAYTADPEFLFE